MFSSLWRGLPRILALAAIGAAFVHLAVPVGRLLGPVAAPVMFNVGLSFFGFAAGEAILRILLPRVDAQRFALAALVDRNFSASIAFGFHCLLRLGIFILLAGATSAIVPARAAHPPASALPYLPTLQAQLRAYAPELQPGSIVGGQVHRETGPCPGRQCWSVHAQMRTQREQGIGFGQFTRTWTIAGVLRFDALTEIVRAHPDELAGLSWESPYDPVLQLRALVLRDRDLFRAVAGAATNEDRWAFTLAGHNAGPGRVRSDRLMCEATEGCDSSRWFGHVERL